MNNEHRTIKATALHIGSIIVSFLFPKYTSLKVGRFPLVAAYCKKNKTIKFGNCVYYDGTTYQKKYKGEKAINFIQGFIDEMESRDRISKQINKEFQFSLRDCGGNEYYETHENIQTYRSILAELLN